jgi:alpha-D-xyloside xylohydrolase
MFRHRIGPWVAAVVASLLAMMVSAPTATAKAVRVALPSSLVVGAGDVSAAVRTAPFGLSFRDSLGREVLGSVRADALPTPTVHLSDLLGVVGDTDVVAPRYAPITFTTGAVSMTQIEPFPLVTGNPFLTVSAGATYSLTDVEEAQRLEDGGVRLTVATDDPSGRTAVVEVRPDEGNAVRTAVRFEPSTNIAFVGAGFRSGPDEAFHGFGGRRNALDQAGQSFFNWIDQTIFDLPLLGGQPQTGWYQQAQFISSRPYGFFLEQSELSRWRMRSDRDDAWQVESNSPGLRFTVAPGRAPQAIATLTAITGRTPVPPAWQVAPIFAQTLSGGTTGKTPEAYEAEIRASLDKIDELDLPYQAFSFEAWWLLQRIGKLDEIIDLIKSHGLHPLVYFRAWAGNDGQGTEDDAAFETAKREGYAATRADGSPYVFSDTLAPGKQAVQLDFTNPRTVAWWRGRVRAALDAGADGFMQDFGEQTMWRMHFADGSTGQSMHNRYPIDFHRTTRQIVEEWHREHPDRTEPMFYVRSGYSGRPGSAAYESANWCGDYQSSWSRTTGLAALTTDMLNRAVGGAYGFQCDTGGYMDLLTGPVTRELFLRWSWFAALTPGNRVHGGPVYGQKFPWSWDDEAARIHRASLLLHRAAEPYILRLWREAKRTGMPITRPLWLAYPAMPGVDRIDQEYLLGPDVLVAPVVTQGATTREVTFPPGCWRDPQTGRTYLGSTTAEVAAPLDRHPYFFTCGTTPFEPPAS